MSTILFDYLYTEETVVRCLVMPNGATTSVGASSLRSLLQHTILCFFTTKQGMKLTFENKAMQAEFTNWEKCIELSEILLKNAGKTLTVELSLIEKWEDECTPMTYHNGKRIGKQIYEIGGLRVIEGNHLCKSTPKSLPTVDKANDVVVSAPKTPAAIDD